MDSVIQMVLDGNWSDLSKYTEKRASDKIKERISEKKADVINRFNTGYDEEVVEQE